MDCFTGMVAIVLIEILQTKHKKQTIMKNLFLFACIAINALSFNGCSKDHDDDSREISRWPGGR